MPDFRRVTDDFSVAPQIALSDLEAAKAAGFVMVINNRPDGEDPFQPPEAEVAQAAKALGLDYVFIPVRGMPTADQAMQVASVSEDAGGPVLAFCRSGTRSTFVWALARGFEGDDPAVLTEKAAQAGYDISPIAPLLAQRP